MSLAYLDNNSTTRVLPAVLDAMLPFYGEAFGNASSLHTVGQSALAAIKIAREQTAQLIGCRPSEIVFTSGGTESDNWAVAGMLRTGDHAVISAIEHSAVSRTIAWLEKHGCTATRVGVDSHGRVDPEEVRRAIQPDTRLISVMAANNETGVIQPVEEIGAIAAEADVWFHTDAVQAAGKIPLSVDRIRCDLLTLTAHKIHGPQGVGALYIRRGTPLLPLLHGGHQEKGRRPGSENLPGIVGFGMACELARCGLEGGSMQRIEQWRDRMENALLAAIPACGVNGKGAPRVANTSNIYFDGIGGDSLVVALDKLGIAISRGAACLSGDASPSSVLMAMGLSGERSRSSVRISFGKLNREEDAARLTTSLPEAVRQLR